MSAAKLPQMGMENRIEELFARADLGDRDALRSLLDLRAKGHQDAFDAVMELNRREAERMARLFA
jgi:hypothetical protein